MTTLLVASSGGHLTELHDLRPRLQGIDEQVTWVTFDTPQTRSLLAGEDVVFVKHTVTRDYRRIIANTVPAARLLRRKDVTGVVTTGAGIALSFLPHARARRLPAHYIELVTRISGPSATGRILQTVPGVGLYTQHEAWEGGRWRYAGSVLDGYAVRELPAPPPLRSAVVTLGAHRIYGFRRLVARLAELLPPEVDVLWQTGATDVSGLPIDARSEVPSSELVAAMRAADVVIGHAGTGTVVAALQAGRCPLIVPRSPDHGEHIDDHQFQFTAELDKRGIVVTSPVEQLTLDDVLRAAALRVERAQRPPPFVLETSPVRRRRA